MNPLREMHVLLVESDVGQRESIASALRGLGIQRIVEIADGSAGLSALSQPGRGFDVVISDLEMEGVDGLEFIRRAASRGVGGLILCSALDDAVLSSAEWMARAYSAPLLGVLKKPFGAQALPALLAKAHGNFTVFSDICSTDSLYDTPDRRAIEDIRLALRAGEFVPYYQPKISLTTGEVVGAEILARWHHPEAGTLTPIQFVDLMEGAGMIELLMFHMLDQACRHSLRWSACGLDMPLAINVSPLTLEQPKSASRILAKIAQGRASSARFTIEITEKAFAHDVKGLLESVLRLRMNGCGISVDDFGTGYSSLQQLNRVPVTELKLDRSFVRRMSGNAKAASIIGSTIDLARKLRLKTVAEGVDTEAQHRMLVDLGCDVAQGYLFARPMPAEAFEKWCRSRELTTLHELA